MRIGFSFVVLLLFDHSLDEIFSFVLQNKIGLQDRDVTIEKKPIDRKQNIPSSHGLKEDRKGVQGFRSKHVLARFLF